MTITKKTGKKVTDKNLAKGIRRKLSIFEIFSLVLAIGMALLFLYPLVTIILRSIIVDGQLSFDGVASALGTRGLGPAIFNTIIIVIISGAISVAIGTIFAWLNERTDAKLGSIGVLLPLIPLLLPPVALSIGWYILAEESVGYLNSILRFILPDLESGPLNIATWSGMIWVYTLHLVPFAYLTVSAAFRNVNPSLEEASRINGAGALRTLFRVSLPAVKPAIGAAFLLVTLSSIALFSVPTIIGTPARVEVLSVFIVRLIRGTFPSKMYEGIVVSVILMLILLVVWWLQQKMSSGRNFDRISGKSTQISLVKLGPWKWVARSAMILYLLASSLFPLLGLLLVSLSPYWSGGVNWEMLSFDNFQTLIMNNPNARASLQNSLFLAFTGATIGMAISAIIMTFSSQLGGIFKKFLEFVTKSPGAISNIIIGVAFLAVYSGAPFYMYGTTLILLLVYVVIYMPQASLQASTALSQIGGELLEASSMSGAGRGKTFWKITFPLMLPGLAAGWAMIFVLMVGDLTASALLAGPKNPVVGFVILSIWENGNITMLAALAVILCLISGVITGSVLLWTRKIGKTRKVKIARSVGQ